MPLPAAWKEMLLRVPFAGKVTDRLRAAGHSVEESETGGLATAVFVLTATVVVFYSFLFGFLLAVFSNLAVTVRENPFYAVLLGLLTTLLFLGLWFRFLTRQSQEQRRNEMKVLREKEKVKERVAQVRRGAMGHFKEAFEAVLKEKRPDLVVKSIHVTDTNPRIRFQARKRAQDGSGGGDKSYLQFRERLFDDTREVIDTAFQVAPNAPVVIVDALLNFINRKAQFVDSPVLSVRAKREVFQTLDTTMPDSFRFLTPLEVRFNDGSEVEPHPEMESRTHRVVERLKKDMAKVDIRYESHTATEVDDWRRAVDPTELFITELTGRGDPENLSLGDFESVMVKMLRRHGFDVPKARTVPGPGLEFLAYHPHPLLGGACLVWARQVSPTLRSPVEMAEELDQRVKDEGRQKGLYFTTGSFTEEAWFRSRSLRLALFDRVKFLDLIRWNADPAMKVDAYGASVRKPLDPSVDLSAMPVPALITQMESLLGNLGFNVSRLARLQAGSVKAVVSHNHPILGGKMAVLARQMPERQTGDEEVVREFLRIMEAEFCTRGFLFLSAYLTPKARSLARASGVDAVEKADWTNLLQTFKAPGGP
jgi:hypothetical protein